RPADDAPDPTVAELAQLAEQLDLTTLATAWSDLLGKAVVGSPSFSDFARALLRVEVDARSKRQRERAMRRSRLGACPSLDAFDFGLRPQLRASVVRELCACRWVAERRGLVLVGAQGTGKSTIALILGAAAVEQDYSVLYVAHTADLLAELRGARVDGTARRVFRRYEKPDVLILDELGYQAIDEAATNDLFRLVSARHGRKSTVVVSNTGFRHWHRFFPSRAQAVATVDRLIDDATILRFTGKSVRKPRDVHGAKLDDDGEDDAGE
ncbi:MAG: IS21-like element helper ATPase IstB, partial [Planctomycetes bacterium]|nr:IS21-like element helper ATPase IstB [Planctomycetota bacterium]